MLRVWGRVYDELGNYTWQPVVTDPDGSNDKVYTTNLVQVLKLNLGESPFYANYGIPGHQSVMTQIAPDYYAALTQQYFSGFFASLIITRIQNTPATLKEPYVPTYRVNCLYHNGVRLALNVPI